MSRPSDWQPVLDAARKFEGRLSRAFPRAVERMRAGVSINDLAMALSAKDPKRALALLPATVVEDALSPLATITRDALSKGGRLGAEQMRSSARKAR